MIYPDEPFYVINGFSPRDDIITSAYNFSVGLKPEIALKAYKKELTEFAFNRLEEMRQGILKSCGMKYSNAYPYKFIENDKRNPTWLLRWCQVEGDACDLGIDGFELDNIKNSLEKEDLSYLKIIEYLPHNIDNKYQAYSLLSIWLNWADYAYSLTK
jgi:hypothetical protein